MNQSPRTKTCCSHLQGARHHRPAAEIAELSELLQSLPSEKGEGRYRCRKCGRLWREWMQYVYDGEVYLLAAVDTSPSPTLWSRFCTAGALWGALFGFALGIFTLPPLPEEAVRVWPSALRPLSEEASRRMHWAVGLLLAGTACGFIVCLILRRRG